MKGTQGRTRMDLKGIILSGKEKKSWSQNVTHCVIPFMYYSQSDQIIENRSKVSREVSLGEGRRWWSMTIKWWQLLCGHGISVFRLILCKTIHDKISKNYKQNKAVCKNMWIPNKSWSVVELLVLQNVHFRVWTNSLW